MHVLIAVLGRSNNDLDLIGIDQKAASHGTSALAVVFGGGENGEYSARNI